MKNLTKVRKRNNVFVYRDIYRESKKSFTHDLMTSFLVFCYFIIIMIFQIAIVYNCICVCLWKYFPFHPISISIKYKTEENKQNIRWSIKSICYIIYPVFRRKKHKNILMRQCCQFSGNIYVIVRKHTEYLVADWL